MAEGLSQLLGGAARATERLARAREAEVAERLGDKARALGILDDLALLDETDSLAAEAAMRNLAELVIWAHAYIQAREKAASGG
jgi:hypothetical protein